MAQPVTAVVMLGTSGSTSAERLVHDARRTAAIVTIQMLASLDQITQIVVASPSPESSTWLASPDFVPPSTNLVWDIDRPGDDFHFGNRLIKIVKEYGLERVLYVGGGSMPLIGKRILDNVVSYLSTAGTRRAITNNIHSSDWMGFTDASALIRFAARLPRDNMLGWVLREQAEFKVRVLPPSAATRLDIDTPTDLVALRWHPDTPPILRSYLIERLPRPLLDRWKAAAQVLDTPARQIALIGRVSPNVWQALQYNTEVWIRVFSEEQGMTASGRLGGGRIQSLLANYMEHVGQAAVFKQLGEIVDAAFFDTRVYLAHNGQWPSAADRYASDLGQPEKISDHRLRRFTEAALNCRAPIVLGAFGVVSGGLYALIETLKTGKDWLSGEG